MRIFWLIIFGFAVLSVVAFLAKNRETVDAPAPPLVLVTTPPPPAPLVIEVEPEPPSPDPTPAADPVETPTTPTAEHTTDWSGVTPRDLVHPPKRTRRRDRTPLPDPPALVGSGTRSDPFVVSWERLERTQHTYQPRRGQTEIPPEVETLRDRYVEIEGYYLAPWASDAITELLFMRYAWDGCCIGVPPTAYAAVEATLAKPVTRRAALGNEVGTLRGVFRIEPFVERDWLLALYVVEEAELVVGP